jgi:hypothetical protein
MKRITTTMLWCILPIMFSVTGCFEVYVRTTISADGSCERIITIKNSSKNVPAEAFPLPLDSTWSVEWKETKDSNNRYEYVARKRFQTPEELEHAYAAQKDSGNIKLHISLHKKFEWFYTYVHYKEVYAMQNAFMYVPVSNYLTPEEIERVVQGEKNDTLKHKVELWDMRNMFEDFYRSLVDEIQRRNDAAVSLSLLAEKKEELFLRLITDTTSKGKEISEDSELLHMFADVLKNKTILSYQSFAETRWETVVNKMTKQNSTPGGWNYSVQMPGILLETNGNVVEGNVVTWKFNGDQIHVGDYSMSASSRVTNMWAFVTTGIAVLCMLIVVIFTSIRKRKI